MTNKELEQFNLLKNLALANGNIRELAIIQSDNDEAKKKLENELLAKLAQD